ncbi:hypothetical protein L1D14_07340 [Vibrio tubiashii]|uniref:hypothetical protein n=1 Tax=Vibrio tubiashii TaxID=29498 RepID=UPI001EFC4327|nr:hypothetical protein [Vibrio tubiashii]MCG9576051.1 hypothetical protein [Vibrio tubiashii]
MTFKTPQLNENLAIVKAGRLMLDAYQNHNGMTESCKIVKKRFPELSDKELSALWIGVHMGECSTEELDYIELVS